MKFKFRYLLFATPLLLIGTCKYMVHSMARVEEGSNVASVAWLPTDASNISYFRTSFTDEARFKIAETGFIKFLASKGFNPEEIKEEKTILLHHIDRSLHENAKTDQDFDRLYYKIKNGLFYQKIHANGGGWTCIYDRDSGIAYYHWAHH